MGEQLSYLHAPRPFKNPNYTKNINRRTKNLKTVLSQERERERLERERIRTEKEERAANGDAMDVDVDEEESTSCAYILVYQQQHALKYWHVDAAIEAPPSFMPRGHYCDITGLEACYFRP